MIDLTLKDKQLALEAAGWKFTTFSRRKGRWVRIRPGTPTRRFQKAIEHAWREHEATQAAPVLP